MFNEPEIEQFNFRPVRIYYIDQSRPLVIPLETNTPDEALHPNYILLAEENGSLDVTLYTERKILRTFTLNIKALPLFTEDPFNPLFNSASQDLTVPDIDHLIRTSLSDIVGNGLPEPYDTESMLLEEHVDEPVDPIPIDPAELNPRDPNYFENLAQQEAWRWPLLSVAGETVLLARTIAEDKLARSRLYQSNMRLAWQIAKKYYWRLERNGFYEPFLDLLLSSYEGIARTLGKFDLRKTGKKSAFIRFSTYATFWCSKMISEFLRDHSHTIRRSAPEQKLRKKMFRTVRQLKENGEPRGIPDIVSAMIPSGLSDDAAARKYVLLLRRVTHIYNCLSTDSLDAEKGSGDNTMTLAQKTPHKGPSVEELTHRRLLRRRILNVLSELNVTPPHLKIFMLRYGLHDGYCYTQEEVGLKCGLTSKRIAQIEHAVLKAIMHPRNTRRLSRDDLLH